MRRCGARHTESELVVAGVPLASGRASQVTVAAVVGEAAARHDTLTLSLHLPLTLTQP